VREVDGQEGTDAPLEETSVATQAEAARWLTQVDATHVSLPVEDPDDRERRVRVRAWLGRRYRLYLFPMADTAEAEQELAR